jgi:hypothetical protein
MDAAKIRQMVKVSNKRDELQMKGIKPESLLTKENLEKWILEDKMTFSKIATDMVGCDPIIVSRYAKSFNLSSPITKKQQYMIAKKLGRA